MLNPVRKRCIMPLVCAASVSLSQTPSHNMGHLFLIIGTNAHPIKPSHLRNSKTANSIPHTDGLDSDELTTHLFHPREAQLLKPRSILICGLGALGFSGKGNSRERIVVVVVHPVLHVFEDVIEMLDSFSSQEAEVADQASHRAYRKRAAGETNEDDFVAVYVVGTEVRVRFANTLLTLDEVIHIHVC